MTVLIFDNNAEGGHRVPVGGGNDFHTPAFLRSDSDRVVPAEVLLEEAYNAAGGSGARVEGLELLRHVLARVEPQPPPPFPHHLIVRHHHGARPLREHEELLPRPGPAAARASEHVDMIHLLVVAEGDENPFLCLLPRYPRVPCTGRLEKII
eukprot:CAMPEP_0185277926 /NCGR_PEP_ID=MMETSP1359-20130426/59772_1 /TAXON_ID=552665 /ORGANISM="Bigelowiella longifila, Strain CCMP242" /LENGTH=151 /DNA_ID=CAMNT_0027872235 /DNA_START=105 /DNA_END=561 /DNA_ORIENTATION=-